MCLPLLSVQGGREWEMGSGRPASLASSGGRNNQASAHHAASCLRLCSFVHDDQQT